MRDFRLRHINRGESGKTVSRKSQHKFESGVTDLGALPSDDAGPNLLVAPEGLGDEARPGSLDRALPGTLPDGTGSQTGSARRTKVGKSRLGQDDTTPSRDADSGEDDSGEDDSDDEDSPDYPEGADLTTEAQWRPALEEAAEELIDRRKAKSNQAIRERNLAKLIFLLRRFYAVEEISKHVDELIPALLRSAQNSIETEQREAQLAMEAISVIAATIGSSPTSQSLVSATYKPLKRIFSTAPDPATKVAVIRTLGALAFFCRVPSRAFFTSVLSLFSEIIRTDGSSVGAPDNAAVVTAAEQMWTFIITRVGVSRDRVEDAIDGFIDQLDSTDADVQIAAGEALVTVSELSYNRDMTDSRFPDGYDSDFDENTEYQPPGQEDVKEKQGPGLALLQNDPPAAQCEKLYTQVFPAIPPNKRAEVLEKLRDLSKVSSRSVSVRNRRRLRAVFSDVYNSMSRHPILGPRYQTSLNWETGRERGNRLFVTLGPRDLPIKHWWQLSRLQAVKTTLKGGVGAHYTAGNTCVVDSLTKAPPRARPWAGDTPASDDEDVYGDDEGFDDDDE